MIYSKFDCVNCYWGKSIPKTYVEASCKIVEDLICWSLELDDLALLEVNVKY